MSVDISSIIDVLTKREKEEFTPDGSLARFLSKAGYALSLAFREKEIFLFVIFQWILILVGYQLWINLYHWIPDSWFIISALMKDSDILLYVEILWCAVFIVIIAMPIGIFSGCMTASHIFTRQNQPSTVASCLKVVIPRAFTLWSFHWRDGIATAFKILNSTSSLDFKTEESVIKKEKMESLAWKTGVAAIIPCIVTGQSLKNSAIRSLEFVQDDFHQIALLSSGYSRANRYLCILCYTGFYSVLYFYADELFPTKVPFSYYFIMLILTLPLVIAIAINLTLLRPIYLLTLSDLYADFIEKTDTAIDQLEGASPITSLIVFIGLTLLAALSINTLINDLHYHLAADSTDFIRLLSNYLLPPGDL